VAGQQALSREIRARACAALFGAPVLDNTTRGLWAEIMVWLLLGREAWEYTGRNWLGHDLQHRGTGTRVEVKQSARRQPWSTACPSPLRFDIAPRTGHYADDGITWIAKPGRAADIYIFALHEGWLPAEAVDHRDPAQWRFLVLPASALPESQKTIAASSLQALDACSADMHTLAATVERLLPRP